MLRDASGLRRRALGTACRGDDEVGAHAPDTAWSWPMNSQSGLYAIVHGALGPSFCDKVNLKS